MGDLQPLSHGESSSNEFPSLEKTYDLLFPILVFRFIGHSLLLFRPPSPVGKDSTCLLEREMSTLLYTKHFSAVKPYPVGSTV